jgi:hypothetical protein
MSGFEMFLDLQCTVLGCSLCKGDLNIRLVEYSKGQSYAANLNKNINPFANKVSREVYHCIWYSQSPITGRPIFGKSRYQDTFEFGYRVKIGRIT